MSLNEKKGLESRETSLELCNGDLERLHSEVAHALSARNFYVREIRRLEKELAQKRQAFQSAEAVYRKLKAKADQIEEPRLPKADDLDDFPM